jgi:cytochrome oxidase Cu insertion factor (SCO1/SenC/PrrC family)
LAGVTWRHDSRALVQFVPMFVTYAVETEMNAGIHAPDFTLQDADGATVRLSDYRGRWVVLSFLRGFR